MSAHAYARPDPTVHPRPALSVLSSQGSEDPAVDAATYRSVFRAHAGAVAVITADAGRGPAGFTATSVVSVSLEPPMVSFAVSTRASSFATLLDATRVVVHFLDEDQTELAQRFATSGIDRFAETRWSRAADGSPVLDDASCLLIGTIEHRLPIGDHHLVVARLEHVDQRRPYRPLIYSAGRYGSTVAHS